MKKNIKQILLGVLVFTCLWSASVYADTVESVERKIPEVINYGMIDGTITESMIVNSATASSNNVRWVQRVLRYLSTDAWPFFHELEEWVDNDGITDILIDPSSSKRVISINLNYETDAGEIASAQALSIPIQRTNELSGGNLESILEDFERELHIYSTAFEALLMDHPEVFWLSGAYYFSYPDMEIYEYDNGYSKNYKVKGTLNLILECEELNYSIFHESYDTEKIRETITEMNMLTDSIVGEVADEEAPEQIRYFNNYLTTSNELNTYYQTEEEMQEAFLTNSDSFECIAALRGSTGKNAPFNVSYAKAFKVLCDRAGIPCCIEVGNVGHNTEKQPHVWNLVLVDGNWYGADITLNDPVSEKTGAVSGNESEEFLLVGSNTKVTIGSKTGTYGRTHEVTNVLSEGGTAFINGPELKEDKYVSSIKKMNVFVTTNRIVQGYTDPAVISVEVINEEGYDEEPEYTWYFLEVYEKEYLSGIYNATSSSRLVFPTVEKAGSYTIRVCAQVGENIRYEDITFEVSIIEDVSKGDWYYDSVEWAIKNDITYGYTNTEFEPNRECTRGQMATFLWRFYGCPEPETTNMEFNDVEEGIYYYEPILWAVENDIVKGYTKDRFAPEEKITRAQLVTILWRAAGAPVYEKSDESGESADIEFLDVFEDDWYYDAVYWAVENSITKGHTSDQFAPSTSANRAEIVTFLYRAESVLLGE